MNFQFYLEKLKKSDEYKKFIRENPGAYFCSGFFSIDKTGNDNKQHFDFYVPGGSSIPTNQPLTTPPKNQLNEKDKGKIGGDVFSFKLEDGEFVKLERINEEKIPEEISLDLDFDFSEIERLIREKMEEQKIKNKIQKLLFSLQRIKGKNMLLGTVLVILVGIVALLSQWFLRISFFGGMRRRRDSKNSTSAIFAVLGIIAAILAPIVATLIKLAISRKREFLADATGALLTRYPEGLARALEKISRDSNPLRVANTSNCHLYISNPFKDKQKENWLTKMFLTHPPIEERIKALKEMSI